MPEYSSAILVVSATTFVGSALPKALCIPDICVFQLTLFVTGKCKKSSKLAAHAILLSLSTGTQLIMMQYHCHKINISINLVAYIKILTFSAEKHFLVCGYSIHHNCTLCIHSAEIFNKHIVMQCTNTLKISLNNITR